MRRLARLIIHIMLALSLSGAILSTMRIASDPALRPLREAGTQQIAAAADVAMAAAATPARLSGLVAARLAESPRNWIAIDALTALAIERAIDLPAEQLAEVSAARAQDFSLLARAASCALCAYNAAACSLSEVLACQVPVALTPVGDVLGISRAGLRYAGGQEVDQVDLALSVVGLGASVAVLASAGAAVPVKAGAALARTAHGMGRLSPGLTDIARAAARDGVDWAGLPAVRALDDLKAAVRPEAFAALARTLDDLERLRQAAGTAEALHLLPLIGSANDARRLSLAAEALGPKLVGHAEVLGKVRLLRTSVRLTGIGWSVIASFGGLMLSAVLFAASVGQGLALRRLRRL